MTLLQTRVDEKTARNFARAARKRGHTPYSFLQELVKGAAAVPVEPAPWKGHRERMAAFKRPPLPYNAVAHDRQESDER